MSKSSDKDFKFCQIFRKNFVCSRTLWKLSVELVFYHFVNHILTNSTDLLTMNSNNRPVCDGLKACVPPNDLPRPNKIGRHLQTKKSADFITDFILFFLVSFLVRIGENSPIWVSHSPTIKDCKKLFLRDLNTKKQCNMMITTWLCYCNEWMAQPTTFTKKNRPILYYRNIN